VLSTQSKIRGHAYKRQKHRKTVISVYLSTNMKSSYLKKIVKIQQRPFIITK